MDNFIRTQLLIGKEGLDKLSKANILLFGVGGVGGYVAEGLARSGVGSLTIVDNDTINESNLNRQIIALTDTIGKVKVDAVKERISKINPQMKVTTKQMFFMPDTEFDFSPYDYVIDAIDTVTAKLEIIKRAKKYAIPVISSMGTGNKLHPELLRIDDITKTSVCPLARVMRRLLKENNISNVNVLYSTEQPHTPKSEGERVVSSIAFVPSTAGMLICGKVINSLLQK